MVKNSSNNSGRGQRELRVKVKTARGRRLSSTLWLERQLNDPYVKKAQVEGYRGRAAYKILEIDDKYRFLIPGARVVDLGCAPGGWCQVAARRTNALGERKSKKISTVWVLTCRKLKLSLELKFTFLILWVTEQTRRSKNGLRVRLMLLCQIWLRRLLDINKPTTCG